mgnify:CR=1 FL=1
MPIIQHLGTAFASGSGNAENPDPFGDGSCRSYYPLNGNQQDINGGYHFDARSGESWVGVPPGKMGTNSWNGTGSNYMMYTSQGVANVTNYTINFWYLSNNQGQSNKRLVTLRAQSYTMGWSNYNNALGFYTGNGSGYTTSVTRRRDFPDNWVNDGNWHMLTCTMTSGNSWETYIDGSQNSGSGNTGDGRSFNADSYFSLNAYNQSSGYNTIGYVDNIRIFNRVLSGTEIADLYGWENV